MTDTAEQSLDHATEADLGDAVETGAHVAAEHDHGAQYNTRVTLKKPIQRQSADMPQVGALYLREPTAGDLRGVKLLNLAQLDAQELTTLLPRIAMPRLSPQEVEKISLRDTLAIGGAIAVFLQ